jgi:myo-inositol-1-phosphate synthase
MRASHKINRTGGGLMSEIRIAIVGVGNCASSLIQGIEYYQDAKADEFVPGLMHVKVGPYHINDIKVVAAFDVDSNKVGRDLADAIFIEPNNKQLNSRTYPRPM